MFKNILAPVDGSAYSKKALDFACDLAIKYDAKLTILNVTYDTSTTHTMVLGASAVTYQANQEELEKAGRSVLNAAADIAKKADCKQIETIIENGSPVQKILDISKDKEIDLIILGSRGLSDIAGLLLGSVSHKVNHLSECTCITVH